MTKYLMVFLLFISFAHSKDRNSTNLSGKFRVIENLNDLNKEMRSFDSRLRNTLNDRYNNSREVEDAKEDLLLEASQLKRKIGRIESSIDNLRYKEVPPFQLSYCKKLDQDHKGIYRGKKVIYGRKGDVRICTNIIANRPNIKISSATYYLSSKLITNVSMNAIGVYTNKYEARSKRFNSSLPQTSVNGSQYFKRPCLPYIGNYLIVKYTQHGNYKEATVEIREDQIYFEAENYSDEKIYTCQK